MATEPIQKDSATPGVDPARSSNQLGNNQQSRSLILALTLGLVVMTILCVVLLILLLTSNNNKDISSSSGSQTGTGNAPGQGQADPYAKLDASQVLDTYMKAYQARDYETCKKLFAPTIDLGRSPDSFKLTVESYRQKQGAISSYTIKETGDDGATKYFSVNVVFLKDGQPTNGGPFDFEIRRVNSAWKVGPFEYF